MFIFFIGFFYVYFFVVCCGCIGDCIFYFIGVGDGGWCWFFGCVVVL